MCGKHRHRTLHRSLTAGTAPHLLTAPSSASPPSLRRTCRGVGASGEGGGGGGEGAARERAATAGAARAEEVRRRRCWRWTRAGEAAVGRVPAARARAVRAAQHFFPIRAAGLVSGHLGSSRGSVALFVEADGEVHLEDALHDEELRQPVAEPVQRQRGSPGPRCGYGVRSAEDCRCARASWSAGG